MAKAKSFQKATTKTVEQITYVDVINMFNELNAILGDERYRSADNLDRPEGGKAIGFVYTGYMAGEGLCKILNKIGLHYTTFMKSGSGITEESEIHIDKSDEQTMRKIIKNIGCLQSNQSIEIDVRNEKNVQKSQLFRNIR